MSIFNRLFRKEPLPQWADFLSQADYHTYCGQLREVLERLAPGYELFPEEGYYTVPGKDGCQFGIVNLAQVWRGDTQNRRANIEEFVGKMLQMDTSAPEEMTYEQAEPLLRIRLYPIGFLPDSFEIVQWPLSDAFVTVLTVDLPDTVQSVNRDTLKDWGYTGTDQEIFDLALDQTWRNESVSVSSGNGVNGVDIRVVSGDSFFSATHALMLDRYVVPADPNGVLLALPHRHTFAFHAIGDGSAVNDAVATLAPMARGMFSEGPGSITPELFWWVGGIFTVLPVYEDRTSGRPAASLPEELTGKLG